MTMKLSTACLMLMSLMSTVVPAAAEEVNNIVLVHGAWVDASGWKPVYDILVAKGSMSPWCRSRKRPSVTMSRQPIAFLISRMDRPCSSATAMEARSLPRLECIPMSSASSMSPRTHPMSARMRGRSARGCQACWRRPMARSARQLMDLPISGPQEFPKLFAPDLPHERAEFMARSQVLAAAKVFDTPLTKAAWKAKPSWAIVAGNDQIINPALERWYYSRAGSQTIEIKGASHAVYESHPKEVAAVIEQASHLPLVASGRKEREDQP